MRSNNYDSPKQLENAKYFKHLGSILIEEGRGACEIKSRIAMQKLHLTKEEPFSSKLD